jgi:hypothetical protein
MPQDKTLLVKLQNNAMLVKKWYIYLDIKLSIIIPYILVHFIHYTIMALGRGEYPKLSTPLHRHCIIFI